ncbi:unnamed protein product [Brachionus calyciflorus]|uniref:Integrase catalytic domain-containing protein n=1 Tax=Brachionus calyciflorus TaxID=104777 RepID=A0A814QYV8_9BILA|nr:unnamed protein product [Brachionus calyciflorus]
MSRAPLQPIITSRPFQLVTCDILGPLNTTERGAKYILVFMCHFTKWEVLELLDVHKLRTTPYHPQCDGRTERFNRTLISMLRTFVNENQDDWDLLLDKLAFAYRTAVHRATGFTPFEMVNGRQPKLPLDLFYKTCSDPLELDWAEYVKQMKISTIAL